MKAAFIDKPNSIICTDVEEPQIKKDNEVKIRVKVTGICGSEVHAYHGKHPYRVPPVVSGHEFAGDIVEVGRSVRNYKVGDRVTAEPQYGCGECVFCKTGKYNICNNKVVLGSNKWSGSFGEYIVVPEDTVIPIPDDMTYEKAALIEPLAVGLHAVKNSGIQVGQTVAIIGAGMIGLSILISAKMAGARNIIVSDILEQNLLIAKKIGATHCIKFNKENSIDEFLQYTSNSGIELVYLAVNANEAFRTALEIVSPKGTIATVAPTRNAEGCDLKNIVDKELKLIGSLMYTRQEFEIVRDKIANGDIDISFFINEIMLIEDAKEAMEIAETKKDGAIKVLMRF